MSQDTINKIASMRAQGYRDEEIILAMQEEGVSAREINDSLAQANIKNAISNPNIDGTQDFSQMSNEQYNNEMSSMQPSLMNQQYSNQTIGMTPAPQEQNPQQENYTQENYTQENYQGYDQGYDQSQGYQYPAQEMPQQESYYGLNTETISEITDQLIQEKLATVHSAISSLAEFKILMEARVEKIDQRLERMEKIMDSLQTSLIRKASESGQDIEDIKNEMKMMQGSFGKMINPMFDNQRKTLTKKHHHKSSSKTTKTKAKKR